MTKMKKIQ